MNSKLSSRNTNKLFKLKTGIYKKNQSVDVAILGKYGIVLQIYQQFFISFTEYLQVTSTTKAQEK